jgi:hypothetical protein
MLLTAAATLLVLWAIRRGAAKVILRALRIERDEAD